jgi:hypothetical protein
MKKAKLTQGLLKSLIKKTISEEVSTNESWFNRLIGREEEPWPPRAPEKSLFWKDPKTGEGHWVTKDELQRLEAGESIDLGEESIAESGRMLGKTGAFRVREPRPIGRPAQAAQWAPRVKTPPTPRVEDAELVQSWKDANPGGTWGVPSGAPSVDPEGEATEEEKQEIMSLLSSDRTSPGQKKDLARRIDIHGPTSRALRVFLRDNPDIYPA